MTTKTKDPRVAMLKQTLRDGLYDLDQIGKKHGPSRLEDWWISLRHEILLAKNFSDVVESSLK